MNFADPTTGAHVQNIESSWWQLKTNLPSTHVGNLVLHFAQYLWTRKFAGVDADKCTTFIRHIAELYPGSK